MASAVEKKRERRRQSSSDEPDSVTPGHAGQHGKNGDEENAPEAAVARKKRKVLQHETLYLSNLPNAERYYKSLMHRDVVNFVTVTRNTNFLITSSVDGHVKFWKKQEQGIEFVKHYRAHLAPVVAVSASSDGNLFATAASDGSVKVFDVQNFDLINMLQLPYVPRACAWVHKGGRAGTLLAVAEQGSSTVRFYDGRGEGTPSAEATGVHRAPVHLLAYNELYDCIVSSDTSGMVEYWSPKEPYSLPKHSNLWQYKSQTDLFDFKKSKSVPATLTFSLDFSRFITLSPADRQVRLFDFASGKLLQKYDESLAAQQERQANGDGPDRLDDMQFGRRLALERDIDASCADALGDAVKAASGACTASAAFDESGNFLIYPSMLGIKVVNILSNDVVMILGKDETMRFTNIALFQGIAKQKAPKSIALAASDNPLANEKDVLDPTLFCTAFKRARFYLFTRNEPESDPRSRSGADRDVINEKPTREEQTIAAAQQGKASRSKVASTAVLHTTMGDIHLRLFDQQVAKTVENFVGLARKGYYDGVIFHRIIKKFMLQTGDPLGDGTGGESLWGKEFEDQFVKELRHDRPYTLSMANAGPNTNGSQFFITTVPTPWLDNKHTVFGRCVAGLDVIHAIENVKTDKSDKPRDDIKIVNITIGT
ncbi:peptidyl-prolyl cis-trans isomerase [Ceraceosorus bombacis]|uniref:peptidylprolyl isomerase n=1 Tax=Ceraceosorus bombacis TaxID=401625 RepID=A0A0P1BSN9_9BASI|nr:peptidyl-prolyl cis-trans isomerase [Ceraceosorus bombacis]